MADLARAKTRGRFVIPGVVFVVTASIAASTLITGPAAVPAVLFGLVTANFGMDYTTPLGRWVVRNGFVLFGVFLLIGLATGSIGGLVAEAASDSLALRIVIGGIVGPIVGVVAVLAAGFVLDLVTQQERRAPWG
jgi:hypothetical protein